MRDIMNEEQKQELNKINLDIIFFFLLIVASLISFYIIVEKKKDILNIPHLSDKKVNKVYNFNKYLILVIDLYFLLNAYFSYQELINDKTTNQKKINEQKIIIIANILTFISAVLYIPLTRSNVEINE